MTPRAAARLVYESVMLHPGFGLTARTEARCAALNESGRDVPGVPAQHSRYTPPTTRLVGQPTMIGSSTVRTSTRAFSLYRHERCCRRRELTGIHLARQGSPSLPPARCFCAAPANTSGMRGTPLRTPSAG